MPSADFKELDAVLAAVNHPDRALRAFYGAGDAARRATVSTLSGAGDRKQEIYTPQSVVDCLHTLWPEGIALDPCSGPESIVPAEMRFFVPGTVKGKRTVYEPEPGQVSGLNVRWPSRTYVNPPFRYLQQWLEKQVQEPTTEVVFLAPVRTHRAWFRRAMRSADVVIWLDGDFKFLGYDQNFPAPLCVLYWGNRGAFEAFQPIGETT